MCYRVIIDRDSAFGDQGDRLGKNDPLRFFHDASLQDLGRIALLHIDGFLQQDRSVVEIFIYKVNGSPRDLGAPLKDFLMDMESVIALSSERRNQGGMNIYDPSSESVDHAGGHCYHKSREYDQVRLRFLKADQESFIEHFSVLIVSGRDAHAFDSGGLCAGQGIRVFIIADDADDLGITDHSVPDRVDDRLEIRSSSRHTNGNSQHNSTPFCAPLSVSPIT